MKKTPLKIKKISLRKTPLRVHSKGLKKTSSLKKTKCLQTKQNSLNKNVELKKQSEKAKAAWLAVRSQILERDNYKCVVCGKLATQVHHIHLRSKRKDLLYSYNNLVSLCDKHHKHRGKEGLDRVNRRIAEAKHITLEELLIFAETKKEE